MLANAIRWTVRLIAIFALGPIAWSLTAATRAPDGTDHIPPILAANPLSGILSAVAAVSLAGIAGLLSARLLGLRAAWFNTACILIWAAAGTGTVDSAVRLVPSTNLLWRLCLEGTALAIPAVLFAFLMVALAARRTADLPSIPHTPDDQLLLPRGPHHAPRAVLAEIFGTAPRHAALAEPAPFSHALVALGLGLILSALAAWLVAQNMLKGQAIAAAAVAGMLAAAALVIFDFRLSPALAIVAIALMAIASPALGVLWHAMLAPNKPLAAHVFALKLFPAARILPLDWLAGGFLGSGLGLSLGAWLTEARYREHAVGA